MYPLLLPLPDAEQSGANPAKPTRNLETVGRSRVTRWPSAGLCIIIAHEKGAWLGVVSAHLRFHYVTPFTKHPQNPIRPGFLRVGCMCLKQV